MKSFENKDGPGIDTRPDPPANPAAEKGAPFDEDLVKEEDFCNAGRAAKAINNAIRSCVKPPLQDDDFMKSPPNYKIVGWQSPFIRDGSFENLPLPPPGGTGIQSPRNPANDDRVRSVLKTLQEEINKARFESDREDIPVYIDSKWFISGKKAAYDHVSMMINLALSLEEKFSKELINTDQHR